MLRMAQALGPAPPPPATPNFARRCVQIERLAVVPLSAATVTDVRQVMSKLPMANRALRINREAPRPIAARSRAADPAFAAPLPSLARLPAT